MTKWNCEILPGMEYKHSRIIILKNIILLLLFMTLGKRVTRKHFLETLVLSGLTLPLIVACAPQTPKSKSASKTKNENIAIQQPQFSDSRVGLGLDFIPLDEGNTWEYRITIPKGNDFYHHRGYIPDGRRRGPTPRVALGISNESSGSGVFTLRYSLGRQEGEVVRVNVEKDEMGFFSGSKEVYISILPIEASGGKSTHLIWRLMLDEPYINSKGFNSELGFRNMDYYVVFRNDAQKTKFMVGSHTGTFDITVPAGTFKECVKQSAIYYGENIYSEAQRRMLAADSKTPGPMKDGWKDVGYFAVGVGMVKTVQYEHNGNELNQTELVSFKVKGK